MKNGWKMLVAIGASAAVVAIASRRWGQGASGPVVPEAREGTAPEPADSKHDVNEQRTTKSKRSTKDVDLESASPTGHEEIEREIAREAAGDGAVPAPVPPSKERRQKRKAPEPDQPLNPRRQRNSRPS